MTSFKDRENAFETKFKQDAELRFKVTARRNKLLGLWAGAQLGLTGDAVEAYAKEVIKSDFEKPGDDDVLEKVLGDLQAKNIEASQHSVRKRMDELMDEAARQVESEGQE